MSAPINSDEAKQALQSPEAWKTYVDKLYGIFKPSNQAAADWSYIYKVPELVNSTYSGFSDKRDENQYQTSMGDMQNILSGNGTIGQLLESAKLASIYGSNAKNKVSKATQYSFDPNTGAVSSGSNNSLNKGSSGVDVSKLDPNAYVTVTSPTGETRQVTASQAPGFVKSGWSVSSGTPTTTSGTTTGSQVSNATTATSNIPSDPNSIRQQLQAAGFDVTGMDDSSLQMANVMWQTMKKQAEYDKSLIPEQPTAEATAKWLEEAKAFVDPYYKEQIDQFKNDIAQNVASITGDYTYQQKQQELAYQKAQEEQARNAAEAGLARSGIRQKAEQELANQQVGLVESNKRKLQSSLYGLGTQAERALGTANLPLISVAGMSYTPQGVKFGSIGEAQKVAEANKQAELKNAAIGLQQTIGSNKIV